MEIALQKDYLKTVIHSVYFGGGTPSLLSQKELMEIFESLYKYYPIAPDAEITLEANPDDLSKIKLKQLKDTPVNRLSIGVQSFREEDLRFMNRAHSAEAGCASIKEAQDMGFENLTVDLIYGTPTLSNAGWLSNLKTVFSLDVPHISSYALTVEPKTTLAHLIKSGKAKNVDQEQSAQQFELLMSAMRRNDFIQYEISNFGKEGFFSRHNSNYWLKEHYLGLGPSAHSYNGYSRQWNVRNNASYIREHSFEKEILTPDQKYNEYILTSLRTIWGVDLNSVKEMGEVYYSVCVGEAKRYIESGDMVQKAAVLTLSDKGKLLSDRITSDLFVAGSVSN